MDSSGLSKRQAQEEERREEERQTEWRDYCMYKVLTDGIKKQLTSYYQDFFPGSNAEDLQDIIYSNEQCLENIIHTRLRFKSSSCLSDMAQPLTREFGGNHAHNEFSKLREVRSCDDLLSQSITSHPMTQTDLITDANLEMEEVFFLDL
jgi:hypothetical protein